MSLIPKENLSNFYLLLYSMFDEFGLGRGATFFRFVGIFPRLAPQNLSVECGETRNLRRWIRSDSYVRPLPYKYLSTPPAQTTQFPRLHLSAPEALPRAPPCYSSSSTLSPLCCRKKVAGDLPVDE